jgi:polyisoprenoid-binding protein YceI
MMITGDEKMTRLTRAAVALAFVVAAALPASAQLAADVPAGTFKIDPTHASVTWRVSHMGLSNYTARFTKVDASLTFDPAKPEAAKLTASIDPMSVRTDFPFVEKENFDKTLAESAKWFDANVAKTITFASTAVKMTGAKTADVTGDLTLRGITKPVVLKVTFNGGMASHPFTKKPAVGFSATGMVKRSVFGMTANIPMIGDEVALLIEAEMLGS